MALLAAMAPSIRWSVAVDRVDIVDHREFTRAICSARRQGANAGLRALGDQPLPGTATSTGPVSPRTVHAKVAEVAHGLRPLLRASCSRRRIAARPARRPARPGRGAAMRRCSRTRASTAPDRPRGDSAGSSHRENEPFQYAGRYGCREGTHGALRADPGADVITGGTQTLDEGGRIRSEHTAVGDLTTPAPRQLLVSRASAHASSRCATSHLAERLDHRPPSNSGGVRHERRVLGGHQRGSAGDADVDACALASALSVRASALGVGDHLRDLAQPDDPAEGRTAPIFSDGREHVGVGRATRQALVAWRLFLGVSHRMGSRPRLLAVHARVTPMKKASACIALIALGGRWRRR